jgi:hypothetical protein
MTPPPGGTVRFAIIGDYGGDECGGDPVEAGVSSLVHSWNPDFITTAGDNNYPDGDYSTIDCNIGQYYHDFIYPYAGGYGPGAPTNRFFPTLGNHDWDTDDAQPYLDYFTLPNNERYYDFTWGAVQFFMLDSDENEPDGITSTSAQAQWLQARLRASQAVWKLVLLHHPPYSSGLEHGSTPDLQWPYRQWGAQAVLAGHDHSYERIIYGGLAYFVNGLGGDDGVYGFGTPVAGSEVRYNDDHGAMLCEANTATLTCRFINLHGDTIDTYTLFAPAPTPTLSPTPAQPTATPVPPTATLVPPTATSSLPTASTTPTSTPDGPPATTTSVPTPRPTPPFSPTASRATGTPVLPTVSPSASAGPGEPTATPAACLLAFNDVALGSTFYAYVQCLACRGIVGGYPCGGPGEPCPGAYFHPGDDVTRGQVAKIISTSAAFTDPIPGGQQTFEDVPPGSTFYLWVQQVASRGIVAGYPCGGNPAEPCIGLEHRPYYRPNNPLTRGQMSKIAASTFFPQCAGSP